MDKVIKKIYLLFCTDESVPYVQTKLDKKEARFYNKLEEALNGEQIEILEDYLDALMENMENIKIQIFEQGIKIGIRLSSGHIESLNL